MQQRSTSRRLALVAMLAFATVSFSTLAGWMLPPAALIPSNAPEPMPLLLLGLVLIAVGLLLRGSEHQVRAAPRSDAPSPLAAAAPMSCGAD